MEKRLLLRKEALRTKPKTRAMKLNKNLLFLAFIGILLASCVPQKKILYLQDIPKEDSVDSFDNERQLDYQVQPGDNLHIKINRWRRTESLAFQS